jgi:putative photosynthetic complex assembly protein 2
VRGWPRFARAVGTIAWHELALAMTTLALIHAAWGAANPFAAWTFAMLFLARVSAKLNLFFGVPRINTEFLPRTLSHLPSHFRLAPMNGFFPLSVTLLSFAAACWLERTVAAGAGWEVAGFSLLLTITLLALLEHWFMVLPVPDQKLWRWMMPAPRPALMRHDRLQEDPNGS